MLTERTGIQTNPNIPLDFHKEARAKKKLAGSVEGVPSEVKGEEPHVIDFIMSVTLKP